MIVRPEQLQEWAEIAHAVRLLVSRVTNARPPLLEADGAVDDTLAALDEAQGAIAGVLSALREDLHQQDQRESGDRDDIGPLPMPRPGHDEAHGDRRPARGGRKAHDTPDGEQE